MNFLFLAILKQVSHAYLSKHSSDKNNQVILLMTTNGKKWHYLSVKELSALLRGITSKHENVCKDHY